MEEELSCPEYGCSYTKDGSPDEVYCFKPGPYQVEAGDECPAENTSGSYRSLTNVFTEEEIIESNLKEL